MNRIAVLVGVVALAGCLQSTSSTPDGSAEGEPTLDAAAAGAVCATPGERPTCDYSACGDGEDCFTQVTCGPTESGGVVCAQGLGTDTDDRCHRRCARHEDCPLGQACTFVRFFGCGDYNGGDYGRGICLAAP